MKLNEVSSFSSNMSGISQSQSDPAVSLPDVLAELGVAGGTVLLPALALIRLSGRAAVAGAAAGGWRQNSAMT